MKIKTLEAAGGETRKPFNILLLCSQGIVRSPLSGSRLAGSLSSEDLNSKVFWAQDPLLTTVPEGFPYMLCVRGLSKESQNPVTAEDFVNADLVVVPKQDFREAASGRGSDAFMPYALPLLDAADKAGKLIHPFEFEEQYGLTDEQVADIRGRIRRHCEKETV
ncbi:MAG: hypothetical protein ABH834_04515 [Candidatus Altiarchaeota archaeon]